MADRGQREGQQLGNYRLIQLLGRGNFAEVYLGQHLHLDTQAAIKVLYTHLNSQDIEPFRSEARVLARLVHPHIIGVLDFGVEDGLPFLVMDYAPHGSLRQLHPKGERLVLETVLSHVTHVAAALQYAHDQRLIHRDLKPENLLLGRHHEVLLSDFGLALLEQSSRQQQSQQTAGTIAYMAPEQLQGHPTPASDQYALGVLVYEWLCGERPFAGSFLEIAHQHLSVLPPSLREKIPTLPLAVEQVVLRALAKDPQHRFARVQDFALALEEASREDPSGQTLLVLASADPAEAAPRAASIHHLPRGTVTLLFSDMEGSTSLLQQLGERYSQTLGECRRLLRAACHRWHGHEVDTQGDSLFVAFARASDALAAAVEAQRALARHGWPDGVTVWVRMGVHTGEPQLSAEGYVGLDVHRAARIMRAGHGGQVLLSQTTRDLVEHDLPEGVSLRDLGVHRLKDLQHPGHLFQLVIARLPADFPPLLTLDTHPNNLPVQPTPFIGREQEVEACELLLRRQEVRLLTLTGPGGIGKTRLGVQVAAELSDDFADGVFFVDLAPISDPALVVPTIAHTCSLREVSGQTLLERLTQELQQRQILLLLDNFEQVVGAAPQVAALLAACPHLKVVVTSREVLHVQAEHEFAVPPLALPDPKHVPDLVALSQSEAVALFIQRAQATKPDFQLTHANARAVVEICACLDGLPLAIELAAARLKLLSPQALLARLDQRLQMLTSGARDAPARQRTLRHTVEWSYQLLDAKAQRLFRQLASFVGGCTLEAVEAVCAVFDTGTDAVPVLERAASLIDKSLLQQTEQEDGEPRFVMLETIRQYGLEALEALGEREVTQQAHAAYYLRSAEEAEREVEGPQQAMWLEWLEREHDNLRAALRWSLEREAAGDRREIAFRLSGALRRFWVMHGHWSEGRSFLERALAGSTGVAASVRAKALITAAHLANMQADNERAEALAEESLTLCRKLRDTRGIALSLRFLAVAAARRGSLAAARSLNEEALALFRASGDNEGAAWSLFNLAWLVIVQGEYARGRALLGESLALHREQGNKWGMASSLWSLAEVLFESQDDQAIIRALLEESLALSREVGDKGGIATSFGLSGRLALSQGDTATARSLVEESLVLNREIGNPQGIAESLWLLARVATAQGDHAAARALYEQGLPIVKEGNYNKWDMAFYLEDLAGMVAAQGELVWAARLWGAAQTLREALGTPLPPVERAGYESLVAAARAQLEEKAFDTAWAEGRAMTLEQALTTQGRETIKTLPADQPPTSPMRSSLTYPDGLTTREVEVLRQVAQGLTDAQVAEQLVISPRTVNTHLNSIYGKIQVTSRSAATRYAIEHHLA